MNAWEKIDSKQIKPGDFIRDKFGYVGLVSENVHPWGFKRLKYDGLTVINHPDKNWYERRTNK